MVRSRTGHICYRTVCVLVGSAWPLDRSIGVNAFEPDLPDTCEVMLFVGLDCVTFSVVEEQ